MNNSDHRSETASGCNNNTNYAGKISTAATEMSLNNKKNLELSDDTMLYDPNDWIDYEYYDVDVTADENNQTESPAVEGTEIKPPINNKPCSEIQTSGSPKCKKRKLPTFDELLENLDYNILYLNFAKLLQFLNSDHKDMCFPFTFKEYGEFFKMIVRNISLLKSKSLDTLYRDICDKILEAANFNKTGFLLTYVYECRKGFQNIVLVMKKVYVTTNSEEETPSSSCSTSSVMPSSQTSSDMDTNTTFSRSPSPTSVSSSFKTRCLRTALAFIKNDVIKTKEFPELSVDQAHYMQLLLGSIIAFAEFDGSLEFKELYRALWEAVRIYSLKYEFKIKCVDTFGGKKNLMIEKIPKSKRVEMAVDFDQAVGKSNQIMTSKTRVSNSGIAKPEPPQLEAPKAEALKPEAPKPEAPISDDPNPVFLKPDAPKSESPKPQVPKPDDPKPVFLKPQVPKRLKNTKATKKMRIAQLKLENEQNLIKQMPSKFIFDTLQSILAFLSDPRRIDMVFVPNTRAELEFYRKCLNWCRQNYIESNFGAQFQGLHYEISKLLTQVSCRVPKAQNNKVNETTGIREVTYIKPKLYATLIYAPDSSSQSTKKKKINLQNILNKAATTDNTQLTAAVNLNQRLRSKKKNKKAKKDRLKKLQRGASSLSSSTQSKTCTDGSCSESCSERGSSWDRSKVSDNAQHLAVKKTADEINQRLRDAEADRLRLRRDAANHISEVTRKEQLKEALSVPVQSDKAMRMMRGMGWSGGALGARGNGITEPIMPTLDIARGAGLGHSRIRVSEKKTRNTITKKTKPKEPNARPSWVSEKSNTSSECEINENDVIVQKTKQLLLDNPTFDSEMKVAEFPKPSTSNIELPKPSTLNFELLKRTTSNVELSKPSTSNVELLKRTTSNVELSKPSTTNIELPKPSASNVELSKPTTFNVEFSTPSTSNIELPESTTSNVELPEPTTSNVALPEPTTSNVELPVTSTNFELLEQMEPNMKISRLTSSRNRLPFRLQILHTLLELLRAKTTYKTLFKYDYNVRESNKEFVHHALLALRSTTSHGTIFLPKEKPVCKRIRDIYNEWTPYVVKANFTCTNDDTLIELTKVPIEAQTPVYQEISPDAKVITEENVEAYIESFSHPGVSRKQYEAIKFKVLFLLNVLNFVKSSDEETELNFNKRLTPKQKIFIEETIDLINMKAKYGATAGETELANKIDSNLRGAFLCSMFNHQYTSVTLNKYFHFKKINKLDNVVKTKSQTSVNIDNFSSETSSVNLNAVENADDTKTAATEITDTGNNSIIVSDDSDASDVEPINIVDSDESSVEEYNSNNAIAKVPTLQPGEDGVNLSEYLHLYKKGKTADIKVSNNNNDSASKNDSNMTENRNNKINVGNGNVFIDNNDNQVVDMKRDCNTEDTDVTMIEKDKNIVGTEKPKENKNNGQPINYKDIVVAKNDGNKNIVRRNIKNITDPTLVENKEVEYIILKTIEISEPTTEELMEVTNEVDKGESMEVTNEGDNGESIKEINKGETMQVINKPKSLKDVNVAQMEEETSINASDNQTVNVETKLEVKTDCDNILKEVGLSEDKCDTQSVVSKTIATEVPAVGNKINKLEIINVSITHTNHPIRKITEDKVIEIQKRISKIITKTAPAQLPLLMCQGFENGKLIYTCHNKKTHDWLRNTMSAISHVRMLTLKQLTKMSLTFYCYFEFDINYLFMMIQLYNRELSTKNWVVENTEEHGNYVVFIIRMDKISVNYIQASGLALFAGIDKIEFSPVWD